LWLVVGLGNPGAKYSLTRHNVGFLVLDEFAAGLGLDWKEKTDYRFCRGPMDGETVVLLEPLTFMNRSGTAVRKFADKFSVTPDRLIVVHDDLDMEAGKLKIRLKGSSGGHRGVESVIQNIGTRDFVRVKIGIGRDADMPAETYVLKKFRKDEMPVIRDAIARAVDSIRSVITEGAGVSMNRFNTVR